MPPEIPFNIFVFIQNIYENEKYEVPVRGTFFVETERAMINATLPRIIILAPVLYVWAFDSVRCGYVHYYEQKMQLVRQGFSICH